MTWIWISLFILEAIAFIAKEHADRQKVVKVLRFIRADRPDLVPELVVTKSWWEQIRERLKVLGWVAAGGILAWLVILATG